MKYAMLLWPHANARYQNESHRLAQAELELMFGRVAPGAVVCLEERAGMAMLGIETPEALSAEAMKALEGHSLMYGLFELRDDGAMLPVCGREKPFLYADLPGILKYKGKTNEMFLQLLINAALYSGEFWNQGGARLKLLDPMCGRATSLFIGANRQWECTGTDVDKNDLKEAEKFFKRYLEYHHFKHDVTRSSLTVRGEKPAPSVQFTFSDTPENYKQKNTASLRLVNADATRTREAFGRGAFHMIVCDLPYGVQHAATSGDPAKLLQRALPGWKEALRPGGTIAVSFNAQTLKTAKVWELMDEAGLEPLCAGPYANFAHWVEQAVTRDIAVCRKNS